MFNSYATGVDTIRGNYLDNTDVFAVMNSVASDGDGIIDDFDNCPATPNGPSLGTCSPNSANPGAQCTSNNECSSCSVGGICSMNQEDADAYGFGDVCDSAPGCGQCANPVCALEC